MRRGQLEPAQQARGVVGHVGEGVAGHAPGAQQKLEDGGCRTVHVGRVADVAVVEANDMEPAAGQLQAEILLPGDHLHAQPHDQKCRRIGRIAEASHRSEVIPRPTSHWCSGMIQGL